MEQFSLEKYLANPSRKVVTREGRKVRILCTNAKSDFPIIALVESINGNVELPLSYSRDGLHSVGENIISNYELFFASEKHEGWINIFKSSNDIAFLEQSRIFKSKEDAEKYGKDCKCYAATVKVEWED